MAGTPVDGPANAPGRRRMLLIPTDDPTEPAAHHLRVHGPRARPSVKRWTQAIQSGTDLDGLRGKLANAGLVEVLGPADNPAARDGRRAMRESPVGAFSTLGSIGAFAASFANPDAVDRARDAAGKQLRFIPDVAWQGGSPLRHLLDPEEKPQRGKEWPSHSGVAAAHREGIRGENVLAGILDTGVDADHPAFRKREIEFCYMSPVDLKPRAVRGFDVDGHGTHVSGTLCGARIGVAPGVIAHVGAVIESETLVTSLWRTTFGLDWMFRLFSSSANRHRPAVVNLSLGFSRDELTPEEAQWVDEGISRMLRALTVNDVLVVAAAGNGGLKGQPVTFPASSEHVLAVGAVDWNGKRADFSSMNADGKKPDIYGYGVEVLSSYERDKSNRPLYRALDGTSMAAPYVAGIACLVRCWNPRLRAAEVRDHLLQTAVRGEDGLPVAVFAR
jgi:serine protease AprX